MEFCSTSIANLGYFGGDLVRDAEERSGVHTEPHWKSPLTIDNSLLTIDKMYFIKDTLLLGDTLFLKSLSFMDDHEKVHHNSDIINILTV